MGEYSPNVMKDTTLQTQEAYQTPSRSIRKPYKHTLENRTWKENL